MFKAILERVSFFCAQIRYFVDSLHDLSLYLTFVMPIILGECRYETRFLYFDLTQYFLDDFDKLFNCFSYITTPRGCLNKMILIKLVHQNFVALIQMPLQ